MDNQIVSNHIKNIQIRIGAFSNAYTVNEIKTCIINLYSYLSDNIHWLRTRESLYKTCIDKCKEFINFYPNDIEFSQQLEQFITKLDLHHKRSNKVTSSNRYHPY